MGGALALELAHYGGIDELAIIWMPAVMGIGLWLILRTGKEEPSEEETTEVSEEP